MSFKDQMKDFDEEFDKERATGGRLADGEYQGAEITESRVEHDEENDTYSWVIKFVQEGEGSIRKWYNLDHEVGRSIAAQDCKRLGYEGKLSGLEKACKDELFIGLICDIVVKTKPGDERDFTNVYINKVHGKGEAATAGSRKKDQTAAADDDIPF